jgi:DNA-binding NtrC family response regulator
MNTHAPHEDAVVLVVEDEAFLREDVIDVLEREGFAALRAANVHEALAVLDQRPGIQAVFTDIQMPGRLDGIDLARHLADRRPEIAVLVTSGRSYNAPDDLPAASRFIPKPYMPRAVASILREMIPDDWTGLNPGFGSAQGDPGSSASRH